MCVRGQICLCGPADTCVTGHAWACVDVFVCVYWWLPREGDGAKRKASLLLSCFEGSLESAVSLLWLCCWLWTRSLFLRLSGSLSKCSPAFDHHPSGRHPPLAGVTARATWLDSQDQLEFPREWFPHGSQNDLSVGIWSHHHQLPSSRGFPWSHFLQIPAQCGPHLHVIPTSFLLSWGQTVGLPNTWCRYILFPLTGLLLFSQVT